jgi:hypothetical protein
MQLYDGRLVEAVGIPSQTGFHLTVATPNITLITVLDVVQLFDGRLVEAVGIPSRTGDRLTACVSSQVPRPTLQQSCATPGLLQGLPHALHVQQLQWHRSSTPVLICDVHTLCSRWAAPCAARSARRARAALRATWRRTRSRTRR